MIGLGIFLWVVVTIGTWKMIRYWNRDQVDHGYDGLCGPDPAARIHLFQGDRYMWSATDNPYEHESLRWETGSIGTILWDEMIKHPLCQPAVIGTIEILKPAHEAGLIAVIVDNEKAQGLGFNPIGLTNGAEWVVGKRQAAPSFQRC